MREELEAFMAETGVRQADLAKKAGLRDPTLIHRTLMRGTMPTTEHVIRLREAMAFFRAEIKARLEKAAEEGRASGAGA